MRLHFRFGSLAAIAMALTLTACSTAPPSVVSSVASPGEANRPVQQVSEETSASDAVTRNALTGTWIYQADSVERFEDTFSSDGRFESSRVILTVVGAENGLFKGVWKVESGQLNMTANDINNPKLALFNKPETSKIISISENELTRLSRDGRRLVFKRKPPADPLLEEYVARSRMRVRLSLVQASELKKFEKKFEGLPPARLPSKHIIAGTRSFLAAAFAPERLQETMLRELRAGMSTEEIRQWIQWYQSSLGTKCGELNLDALQPEVEAERDAFVADLRQNPAPPERVKLVQEIDKACKLTESQVTYMQSMGLAFAIGSNAVLPPAKQLSLAKITEDVERQRQNLLVMMEPVVVGRRLYAFRSLSMPELQEYFKNKTSDLGKKQEHVSSGAFRKAMLDAMDRFFQSIQWAIEQQKDGKSKMLGT
jgi:hypothetical protein